MLNEVVRSCAKCLRIRRALFRAGLLIPLATVLIAAASHPHVSGADAVPADAVPVVHDPHLQLALVAEDPQIVTPIGLAIDGSDRLFVLESHTHERPTNYQGPETDRIKVFTDHDQDGTFEDVKIFAEDIRTGMNLAFSPDGVLHVVCAREVLALPDADGDNVCDGRRRLLTMKTDERYSHNCLLGITFDRDGWMYLARGNTAGREYELMGTDGSTVGGYGDGGSIVRCRFDGSQVEEFATGFWNPFQIKFDHAGRLLCVDNDPDARGPNRLVHVVKGGDYGYRSLYGGGGNHPFQGWEGDLPGTLPYVSGTGEAPCDLLDARRTSLPMGYTDSVLITVWNENTIERHATTRRGVSLAAESSILVSGGDNFRPVAIEADSHGNIYFTDWVLVAYPNHGRGRLWRLSAKAEGLSIQPRGYFDEPQEDAGQKAIHALAAASEASDLPEIRNALINGDMFLRHGAVMALSQPALVPTLQELARDSDADLRLGSLLAAERAELAEQTAIELLRRFLADPDERVRRAALIWAGTSMRPSLRADLDQAMHGGDVSAVLFETYLAAVQNVDPRFANAVCKREKSKSSEIPRQLEEGLVESVAADDSHSPEVRALAVMRLRDLGNHQKLLLGLARESEPPLQSAAIRRLSDTPSSKARQTLLSLALDDASPTFVRAEALLALSRDSGFAAEEIIPLLDDPDASVAVEAARTLRQFRGNRLVIAGAREKLAALRGQSPTHPLAEQLMFVLGETSPDRPDSLQQWKRALAAGPPRRASQQ